MGLLRKLFWFAIFLFFTLCWVTVLEHGTTDFSNNLKVEFGYFKALFDQSPHRPADTSDDPAK